MADVDNRMARPDGETPGGCGGGIIDRAGFTWFIGPMRWEQLFTDLEARFEDLERAEEEQGMPARERLVQGATTTVERLRGALGLRVRVTTRAARLAGELLQVGVDWVLLEESPGRELLVPIGSVTGVEGLTARTGAPTVGIGGRLDLRFALRGLARDRSSLSVFTAGGAEVNGTIDRVGADHVEVALHAAWEARRSAEVRSVMLVPLGGLDHVRAVPLG